MCGSECRRVYLAGGPDANALSDSGTGGMYPVEVGTGLRVTQGAQKIGEQPLRPGYLRRRILEYQRHRLRARELKRQSSIDRACACGYFRCGKVHLMNLHKNQPFIRRLRFALQGLAAAWRSERNFRIQLGALVCVVIVLVALGIEPIWWALVLLTSGSVLAAELFNTALEHLADHVHPQTHVQIQIVKDCAAAAVLVASCAAIAVGVALLVHVVKR